MSFRNPPVPWSQIERRLSDDPLGRGPWVEPVPGDGGDSPAWSRKRGPYEAPSLVPRPDAGLVPYAELHCHTNFSFLDGASHPEELAAEAARLGLEALAVTDHDGCYGVVRFAEAARAHGLRTVFGAELTLGRTVVPARSRTASKGGQPDPGADHQERHLLVLARDPQGYARLARAISQAQLRGEKGAPRTSLDELADPAGADGHHWQVLTGCRKGAVPAALMADGPAAAARELDRLIEVFGRDRVTVELWDHGDPLDSARNDALAGVAVRAGVEVVATNNVHYATPADRRLATALAAVRGSRQPRRAGRLAARLGRGASALRGRAGPSLRPLPRRGRARRRARARVRLRPGSGGPRPAALSVPTRS